MSDGIAWAYEQREREEHLKSLGLCLLCEQRKCDCAFNSIAYDLKRRIKDCRQNIRDIRKELSLLKKIKLTKDNFEEVEKELKAIKHVKVY